MNDLGVNFTKHVQDLHAEKPYNTDEKNQRSINKLMGRHTVFFSLAFISHATNVMLKILQVKLQQYVNKELPEVQTGFRKGWVTRGQIANICWIIKKAREFQENIYFCFIDYTKAFV